MALKTSIKIAKYCSLPALMAAVGVYLSTGEFETRLTQEDIKLIVDEEGCRLQPYYCTQGVLTNGVGHTSGEVNKQITEEQAAKWLVEDLQEWEECVVKYFNGKNAPKYVYGALVSIAHNTGCRRLRIQQGKETQIMKFANQGNWKAVCGQFNSWAKQKELKPRRARETAYCMKGI